MTQAYVPTHLHVHTHPLSRLVLSSVMCATSKRFPTSADVEEIVLEVENVPLRSDIARILLSLLQVPAAQGANLPADFHSLCQMWFSSGCDCSLEVLVRALLCTPTLGYLVTGLTSICELNFALSGCIHTCTCAYNIN